MKLLIDRRTSVWMSLLVAAAVVAPTTASGQQVVWSSTAETTGDDLNLVYSQLAWYAHAEGVSPFVSLGAYGLWVDGSDTWEINPGVGVRVTGEGGMLSGRVGYAFQSDDDDALGTPFFGGDEDGFTSTAMAEYWGDGGFSLQGIASTNWASEFLWTRGRATVGVAELDRGNIHVGGDVVWQADLDDDPLLDEFESWQYGPLVQWRRDDGIQLTGGAGWKSDEFSDDTYYIRLGLVIVR